MIDLIVDRLKALRQKAKLTQTELAAVFGFSNQRYNYYETGKNEPDNETLLKFADYFRVSTDYLLGNTDDPTPPDEKKATPVSKTPSEAAIEYFIAENGREPTIQELEGFLAIAKGLFKILPNKAD